MAKKPQRGRPAGPESKVLYARLPIALHAAIKEDAEKKGQAINVWIVRALQEAIKINAE